MVFDLSDKRAAEAITPGDLARQARQLGPGDLAILRTDWTDRYWGTTTFWEQSPYLTPDAARWLVAQRPSAVVYDFSEEFVVRTPGFKGSDCIVHHTILGAGIYNIEYVVGLGQIRRPTTRLMALPLRLMGVEAAPARVIAIEE